MMLQTKTQKQYKNFTDFRDIDISLRKQALNAPAVARKLINFMPSDMFCTLIDYFLNPPDRNAKVERDERFKKLYGYFADPDVSIVTSNIIHHKISSHKALEPLYDKYPAKQIDPYFFDSPSGDAIPARLNSVIKILPGVIREIHSLIDQKTVNVLLPGSGTGRDIIRVLVKNPDLQPMTRVVCVDNEQSAIDEGQSHAKGAGIGHCIEFQKSNLMQLSFSTKFELAVVVGIICPLSNKISATVISQISSYCRAYGFILFSCATQKMLIHDPLTCCIMDIINWKLHYKSEQDLQEILRKTNLKEIDSFHDEPYRFHSIKYAQRKY